MKERKYNFYLNPHDAYKWTKCPKCDKKTKVRKHCLMIHYNDKSLNYQTILSLNKSCKFCTPCELIIVQKSEIEGYLKGILSEIKLKFNSDNYLIFGTLEKAIWKQNAGEHLRLSPSKVLSLTNQFKDVWDFEIQPAGWYFGGK